MVAAGLLTVEQAEQGLRAQVMWGGRLGTNLVELGYFDLDTLTQQLARQRRIPAALARHFDKANVELQRKISPATAERYAAVPLMRIGPQGLVGIASTDAIDRDGLRVIADELGVATTQLMPAIAAELRIRYHLERVYQIPRPARFLRSRGKTVPPFPHFEIAPLAVEDDDEAIERLPIDTSELVALNPEPAFDPGAEFDRAPTLEDDLAIASDAIVEARTDGRDRRTYIRTIADDTDVDRQALGRIAIRRVAIATNATLAEATRAIRRSTDRDKVAELVVATIDRFLVTCEAAILLVIRGNVAVGWKGFCRSGNQLPEIGVPLDQAGLVPRVVECAATARSPSRELGTIDQRLLRSLGAAGDLAVVPVTIGDQVMCVIALVTIASDAQVASVESIAGAAGAAFARLMRDASR